MEYIYIITINASFSIRRFFHLYTYLFLFYNIVSGALTAVKRVALSFALTLLFIPRLDRPLIISGWEWLDGGNVFNANAICNRYIIVTRL